MPLIIPPVKRKSYDMYGKLFRQLWTKAEERLVEADEIVVIGYSFPATDTQSDHLFRRAFSRRASMPRISILDPAPERARAKFVNDLGITEDRLNVLPEFFTRDTDLASLVAH